MKPHDQVGKRSSSKAVRSQSKTSRAPARTLAKLIGREILKEAIEEAAKVRDPFATFITEAVSHWVWHHQKRRGQQQAAKGAQTKTSRALAREDEKVFECGWQTPEAAGIDNPEGGEAVRRADDRAVGQLRYSEEAGYYLFDRRRVCRLNGKPSWEFAPMKLLTDAMADQTASGEFKLRFRFGPARQSVKRLSRSEAIAYCLACALPDRFRDDVTIVPAGEGRMA